MKKKIADLIPDSRNANKGTEYGRGLLEESLREFGAGRSILLDKKGRIIAGNKTVEVAGDIGIEDVVVVKTRGDQIVAVQREDLDLDEGDTARRLAYADNRVAEVDLCWDEDILAEDAATMDLSPFFRDEELPGYAVEKPEPDSFNEPLPENPITRLGDLYCLGQHRLLCGDATNRGDVERLMDGKKSRMVHTDPPYNVNYCRSSSPKWGGAGRKDIRGDQVGDSEWREFCAAVYRNFRRFNTGDIYMWGASGPEGMRMRLWLIDMGCNWSTTIVWKKQHMVFGSSKYHRLYESCFHGYFEESSFVPATAYTEAYESCFYGWFGKSSYVADRKQVDVWEVDRPHVSDLHPTMKPVELCGLALRNSSKVGDIVLDLFAGSGSTAIAAEQMRRPCYMMELDPAYCDVIVRRWAQFVGLDPAKIFGQLEKAS